MDETCENGLDSGEEKQRNAFEHHRQQSGGFSEASRFFAAPGVPFKSLTDYLEHERSLSEFLEDFPSVTRADAIAALEEAGSAWWPL